MQKCLLKSNIDSKHGEKTLFCVLLGNSHIFFRISAIIAYYSFRRSTYKQSKILQWNQKHRDIVAPPTNEKPMAERFFFLKSKKRKFILSNIIKSNFYIPISTYICFRVSTDLCIREHKRSLKYIWDLQVFKEYLYRYTRKKKLHKSGNLFFLSFFLCTHSNL